MSKLKPVLVAGCTTLLFLGITACALSPQTITLSPSIDTFNVEKTSNKRLQIEIQDKRNNNILGYRGGVYETAYIATAEDATETVYIELANTYRSLGFDIVDGNFPASPKLDIEITQLKYTARQINILWEIEVLASFRAIATFGTRTATNQLQERFTKEYAKPPSVKQNEEVINNVFSKLLQRVIEDDDIMGLLKS